MGQDDPSMKRLGVILSLFIFVVLFNLLLLVCFDFGEPYHELTDTSTKSPDDLREEIRKANQRAMDEGYQTPIFDFNVYGGPFDANSPWLNFIGFFFGGYLLTTAPNVAAWINVFVIPIYIFVLVIFWYLILDYVKDITILGSHL